MPMIKMEGRLLLVVVWFKAWDKIEFAMLELPRNNVLITSYIVAAGVQLNYYLTATISHFLVRVWRTKSWESRPHIFLIKISFPFWLWTIFMILAWSPHTQLWAIGRDHVNNIKVIWKCILPQLKFKYDKVTFLKIPCCGQHIMITIGKNYCPLSRRPPCLLEMLSCVFKAADFWPLSRFLRFEA